MRRSGIATGTVATAILLIGGMLAPAAADTGARPGAAIAAQPGEAGEQTPDWRTRDASARGGVDAVLGSAPAMSANSQGGAQRIVVVRETPSGPDVEAQQVPDGAAARKVVAAAQSDSSVISVNVAARLTADATNDPHSHKQWALPALKADQAWAKADGSGAVVAVVDSGVNAVHPDLAGKVLAGATFSYGAGRSGQDDDFGHGTHIAGLISATANNGVGIAGLSPGAKILPVKALDSGGAGWDDDIAAGIIWAANKGAHVINLSLGGPDRSPAVSTAVRYAQSKNILVVASSGNDGSPVANYPGADAGVLTVTALDNPTTPADYSDYGTHVELSAPGTEIVSLDFQGDVDTMSGTSFAAPYAAAAAALMFDATNGAIRGKNAHHVLMGTASDIAAPGYDRRTGFGILNPPAAIDSASCLAAGTCSMPLPTVVRNGNQALAQRVWFDMMGRTHDGAWVSAWGSRFAQGTKPSALTDRLTSSSEYRRGIIAGYYPEYLNRSGSAAGVSHWERRMILGWSFQQIQAGFLASNNYYAINGGNDRAWLTSLYRKMLHREPTEPGLQYWLRQRRAGASRETVAYRFVMCDQALARLTNLRYQEYIGRNAHPIMQESWARRLRSTYREENLIGSLVNSREYRARV